MLSFCASESSTPRSAANLKVDLDTHLRGTHKNVQDPCFTLNQFLGIKI